MYLYPEMPYVWPLMLEQQFYNPLAFLGSVYTELLGFIYTYRQHHSFSYRLQMGSMQPYDNVYT